MGTSYTVRFKPPESKEKMAWKAGIERSLQAVNDSMSTYLNDSEITRFNRYRSTESFSVSTALYRLVKHSVELSESVSGIFDITVQPLVNLWGFGPAGPTSSPSSVDLSNLLLKTGFNKLDLSLQNQLRKTHPELEIDLSSIAKGFGVDQIAGLLESKAVESYLVEIGGEIRVKGLSPSLKAWKVGISRPDHGADPRDLIEVLQLSAGAVATSGNYRNYREENSRRWSHFIDPRSGRPRQTDLASATILGKDCETVDAYATIAMLLGSQKAEIYLKTRIPKVDYVLISRDGGGDFKIVKSFEE